MMDMIGVSIAETHRFGRVRKSGYDPIEVDAVMARLVDELRRTEERLDTLAERLDVADASTDAIRRTFVAAESTRDEIIEDARTEAAIITEAARNEAREVTEIADELHSEIATSREAVLTEVYSEADRRRSVLERTNAERSTSVEWALHEATSAASRSIAETEAITAIREHEAHMRADDLRTRIESMEHAASALERAATTLAESVSHEAKIVDLTAIEQLDRFDVEDLGTPASVGPDTATTDKPLLSIAEPADGDGTEGNMPQTRYQRSTGVPLRERIKIARMSG